MKILAIHPGADLPSARIRVVQMAPYLARLDARVQCVKYPKKLRERRDVVRSMRAADIVFMHYRLPTLLDAVLWRGCKTPIVFDFDDAILYRQTPKNGSFESSTRSSRFARILRRADAFSCGNRYLESLIGHTTKPIHITPTPVPLDVPQRGPGSPTGPVRIGWIGGRGNLDSLEKLSGSLARLSNEHEIELAVIADAVPEFEGVKVVGVPWSNDTQEQELAKLDIGLMPLEDNPWNRGKCAYKLLQYMAAGVAVIGSPVGMNQDLIRNSENGMLAHGREDWYLSLKRLIQNVELRDRLGRAGRETVEREYGYETVARGLTQFFHRVAGSR